MEILLALLFITLLCLSIGSLLLGKKTLNQLKLEIFCHYTILIILILIIFKTNDLFNVLASVLCAIPIALSIPLKTKRLNTMKING